MAARVGGVLTPARPAAPNAPTRAEGGICPPAGAGPAAVCTGPHGLSRTGFAGHVNVRDCLEASVYPLMDIREENCRGAPPRSHDPTMIAHWLLPAERRGRVGGRAWGLKDRGLIAPGTNGRHARSARGTGAPRSGGRCLPVRRVGDGGACIAACGVDVPRGSRMSAARLRPFAPRRAASASCCPIRSCNWPSAPFT